MESVVMPWRHMLPFHDSDVIMGTMASEITSITIVYSTVYSDADERKHQSSTSLAFVKGIHRWPVNSPHKGPVSRNMFPFDDVIVWLLFLGIVCCCRYIIIAKETQIVWPWTHECCAGASASISTMRDMEKLDCFSTCLDKPSVGTFNTIFLTDIGPSCSCVRPLCMACIVSYVPHTYLKFRSCCKKNTPHTTKQTSQIQFRETSFVHNLLCIWIILKFVFMMY